MHDFGKILPVKSKVNLDEKNCLTTSQDENRRVEKPQFLTTD
jgi:hypothetical protein